MLKLKRRAISLLIGFVLANFGFQLVTKSDWERAADRSFFQAIALVTMLIVTKPLVKSP